MKRYYRIFRIWYYGKLPYAKKYKKWLKGMLFRQLLELAPKMYESYQSKYGNVEPELFAEIFNKEQVKYYSEVTGNQINKSI